MSRTKEAPTMSSAAVSEATTQPRSSRPSDSGRTPCGSRHAYSVFSSMNVRQNAPRTVGSSSSAACSSEESAAPWASSAPENVGVRRRRSRAAPGDQPRIAGPRGELSGVDQIPVVPQRNPGAGGGIAEHGLGVFPRRVAGGGVAAVPDGDVTFHGGQRLLVEHLTDQAEVFEDQYLRSIGDGDSRRPPARDAATRTGRSR